MSNPNAFRRIAMNDYSALPPTPDSIPIHSSVGVLGALLTSIRSRFLYAKDDSISYIWSNDPKTTDITIEADLGEDVSDLDMRPSILIGRSDIQSTKIMLGDRMGTNITNGKEAFYNQSAAPFIFTCRSTQKGEAEILGNIVYEWLILNEDIFRTVYQFVEIGPYSLGREMPNEKQTTIRECVVSSRYVWELRWTTKPIAPKLGDISFALTATFGEDFQSNPNEEYLIKVATTSFNR